MMIMRHDDFHCLPNISKFFENMLKKERQKERERERERERKKERKKERERDTLKYYFVPKKFPFYRANAIFCCTCSPRVFRRVVVVVEPPTFSSSLFWLVLLVFTSTDEKALTWGRNPKKRNKNRQ